MANLDQPDYGSTVVQVNFPSRPVDVDRPALKDGDGGGTSGGMSDDWKASVESQLTQLHGDVRLLIGAGIAALLVALGAISVSYMALSSQITSTQVDVGKMSVRVDAIDKRLDSIDAKLDKLVDAQTKH